MILCCSQCKVTRHDMDSISFRRHTCFKILEKSVQNVSDSPRRKDRKWKSPEKSKVQLD